MANKKVQRHGAYPINSRIDIFYEKGKSPRIRFGYPHKKQQQHLADHTGPHTFVFLIIYAFLSLGLFYFLLNSMTETIPYPKNCSAEFTYSKTYSGLINGSAWYHYNDTIKENQIYSNWSIGSTAVYNRSLDGMNISCDGFNETLILRRQKLKLKYNNPLINEVTVIFKSDLIPGFKEEVTGENIIYVIIIAILFYALAIFWMILGLFLNKYAARLMLKFKWYQKIVPEWNKRVSGRGYYKIIKEVPANKIVELPLFKNIYLDYNAKGEFAKYLERVEIREHPFCKGIFKKGKLKKKKGDNYMLWYARFYFKEIPRKSQKNYLIIWWK